MMWPRGYAVGNQSANRAADFQESEIIRDHVISESPKHANLNSSGEISPSPDPPPPNPPPTDLSTRRLNIAILSLIIAALSHPTHAQTITASMTAITHNSYAGVAAQFHLTNLKAGGNEILGGEGYLFCADLVGRSLDEDSQTYPRLTSNLTLGTMEQMSIWDRFNNTQDEPLARAMAHWAIDTYYESHFLNPVNNTSARQYAFQNVIWEIFGDGGTSAGLNFSTGNINRSKFGPYGSDSSPTLWSYMTSMLDGVKNSGVTTSYVPKYEVLVALDSRSTYQDYLLLAANTAPTTIPETSSTALIAVGLSMLVIRRKRNR